eukprot:TRINITY_DN512_c0_g1_i1.p1 TRINITY_DN512_c0_g1~~TRINITY_DN512_c0_g1_i1.p1  ORF type:complete len:138 (-),score=8.34 TRINITY_DN512_c0_g1_i1:106-519(-)
MDCCHSGTALDLPFIYRSLATKFSDYVNTMFSETAISINTSSKTFKVENENSSKGTVVLFSGCSDHQKSGDLYLKRKATGGISHAFIATLLATSCNISYVNLLFNMQEFLYHNLSTVQNPQLSTNLKDLKLTDYVNI